MNSASQLSMLFADVQQYLLNITKDTRAYLEEEEALPESIDPE